MKERITVKVPIKGGAVVEFKLRAADIADAVRVMDEATFNPLVLIGAKDSVKYAVKVVERIPVPILGRILELRGLRARIELVERNNEYVFTNEREEQLRLHSTLYGKLVCELLTISSNNNGEKAWSTLKALTPS